MRFLIIKFAAKRDSSNALAEAVKAKFRGADILSKKKQKKTTIVNYVSLLRMYTEIIFQIKWKKIR